MGVCGRLHRVTFALGVLCGLASPAHAGGLALALSQSVASIPLVASASSRSDPALAPQILPAASFVITTNSQCITYSYDENGNRTAVTPTTLTTGAVQWGSGTYGCFVWHS